MYLKKWMRKLNIWTTKNNNRLTSPRKEQDNKKAGGKGQWYGKRVAIRTAVIVITYYSSYDWQSKQIQGRYKEQKII